ncbi:uncharacterized protein N7515_002095 [Penicillium bovifimosum]|uniref:Uncharacterized protein n=1 Tax=Penicillium bovifimosum TaxID=126998 RepID=A0A9W9HB42_9EURO|nr:uncharacterized protein N7515_002095 [Penicillium bovifimosum]KAJ5143308.1 hypothetical protein N7515_002095 [Penicillium bovifimosum]
MTETHFRYDMASWPGMDGLIDFQMGPGSSDDFDFHPFIAGDFPLTADEELDPSWTEHSRWLNDYPAKVSAAQPYPQSWYDAGLVKQDCAMNAPTSLLHNKPLPQITETPQIHTRADQLTTQRALFMTPSPNPLPYPFPGTPASDPRASPGPSHASSSRWEGEFECDDAYTFHFDATPTLDSQYQAQNSRPTPSHHYSPNDDEECFTPLEMPDGSTRLTSNWLPVDQDCGFTIGSTLANDDRDAAFRSVMAVDENVVDFGRMKGAFFTSDPAAWGFER